MFKRLLALALVFFISVAPVVAAAAGPPSFSPAIKTFGDYSNANPAPTSGTLTGSYSTKGPWVQTGPITCNRCRLKFGSSVQINDTFAGAAGVEGNAAPLGIGSDSNDGNLAGSRGAGPGGGFPYVLGTLGNGSSGGGHGGAGGAGATGNFTQPGGPAYDLGWFLAGSSGGGMVGGGNNSGAGGAGIYIEALGNITITGSAVITATGGNGVSVGSGGAGGGIDIRGMRNLSVLSGAVITAAGGNGLAGQGGGGGGIIRLSAGPGLNTSIAGGTTITAAGGTSAGGGVAGSAGTVTTNAPFNGPRVSF